MDPNFSRFGEPLPEATRLAIKSQAHLPLKDRIPAAQHAAELGVKITSYRAILFREAKKLRNQKIRAERRENKKINEKLEKAPIPAKPAIQAISDAEFLDKIERGELSPADEDYKLQQIIAHGTHADSMRAMVIRGERRNAANSGIGPPPPTTEDELLHRLRLILKAAGDDMVQKALKTLYDAPQSTSTPAPEPSLAPLSEEIDGTPSSTTT